MSRHWFPHYVGDYMRSTGHLSLVEDGAYRRLLDHYYSTGKPLVTNVEQLFRVCRAVTREEQDAVNAVVAEFFVLIFLLLIAEEDYILKGVWFL